MGKPVARPANCENRNFFSIWINDPAIAKRKLLYNIHALKLRHLEGYSIASRKFAERFSRRCAEFGLQWPNVSLNYGPLTLMEGWIKSDPEKLQEQIIGLANGFLELEPLVDQTIDEFKV